MTQVVIKDRVKETSTTIGTGSMTLDGAVQGFQSFAAIGNGNLTFYTIAREGDFEVGVGMYFTSGPTLQRNAVLDSSNSGNLVNWGAGEKEVFVTLPASAADFVPVPNVFEYLTTSLAGTGALGSANAIGDILIDYLVIAGGGGGGGETSGAGGGAGGGGAGGFREFSAQSLAVGTAYTVTVGAGGAGAFAGQNNGVSGSSSVFNAITSAGGGFGSSRNTANGAAGGSGGGGSWNGNGGAGNTPSTSPSQGNNGGGGFNGSRYPAGGGGGASQSGAAATTTAAGRGGDGASSSITGTSVARAGGGGGGAGESGSTAGSGGTSGGGAGGDNANGTDGTVNTGGGGGGGGSRGSVARAGGAGGSGVVILKYPDNFTISNPGGGLTSSTPAAAGGFKVTTFTAGTGNVQWSL